MPGTLDGVASQLPEGEPAPADGALPEAARAQVGSKGFGVYVHIPFCASRCGYCDFNTYAPGEGASQAGYVDAVIDEIALAARVLEDAPPVQTVFFGGGTPTLLPASDLNRILAAVDKVWRLAGDVEVTTEANPESVDLGYFRDLRAGGFTRISLGMQSTSERVLALLDRRHTPGRAVAAADEAKRAGFPHVNLDLIYGTPGESAAEFDASLAAVIGTAVDHVSAYSLIVEDGTRMAARMRRGEMPYPSDDVAADRYLAAEAALSEAGFGWYEVSNWARTPHARCRHNLLYWTGGDWWGFGPGAHSHVGGVRWWNVKHPTSYVKRLADGVSPAHGREQLTPEDRHVEDVMLRIRLDEGLPMAKLDKHGRAAAARALHGGLLREDDFRRGVAALTLRGRLLADAVVRDLLP
jgi:putative oxygen-independent coproporphyrinogen III oxidase